MKKILVTLITLISLESSCYYSTLTLINQALCTVDFMALMAADKALENYSPLSSKNNKLIKFCIVAPVIALSSSSLFRKLEERYQITTGDLVKAHLEFAQLLKELVGDKNNLEKIERIEALGKSIQRSDDKKVISVLELACQDGSKISFADTAQTKVFRAILRLTAAPTFYVMGLCAGALLGDIFIKNNSDSAVSSALGGLLGISIPFADLVVTPIKNYINNRGKQSIQTLCNQLSEQEHSELLELNYILAQLLDEVYTDPAKIADAQKFLEESLVRSSSLEDATKRELSSIVISAAQQILYSIETEKSLR